MRRDKLAITILFLLFATWLLFANLGKYALWDDESYTALAAKGILTTGDTTAVCGDNIVAYRQGMLLCSLKDRSTPPLSSYITFLSFVINGISTWSSRLPFAAIGLIFCVFFAVFVYRSQTNTMEASAIFIAFLGNASIFLYFRQCRYYGPAMLFSSLLAILYLHWKKGWMGICAICTLIILLFSANYMMCLAVFACLGFDFIIWKRKEISIQWKEMMAIGICIGLPCLAIASVWNPYTTKFGSYPHANSIHDRLTLLWWNLRDMNESGFLISGLMILGAYFALFRSDVLMKRGLVALCIYIIAITMVSPQPVKGTSSADIRYLVPMIPLCITLAAIAYLRLLKNHRTLCLALLLPVFWTNLASGTFLGPQGLRSYPAEYIHELISPVPEPYTPASDWVREHVPKGSSVWVLPDYMTYPLMFHAPDAVYAWQLSPNQKKEEQFRKLPDVHFQGMVPPDYIIIFGPIVTQIRAMLQQWQQQGIQYEEEYRINTFWKDLYRPEVIWRTFRPITGFDVDNQAIYIYKLLKKGSSVEKISP
jgi:hypothetical protein